MGQSEHPRQQHQVNGYQRDIDYDVGKGTPQHHPIDAPVAQPFRDDVHRLSLFADGARQDADAEEQRLVDDQGEQRRHKKTGEAARR